MSREESEIFVRGATGSIGEEEAISLALGIGDAREGEDIHIIRIEKGARQLPFAQSVRAGNIREFDYDGVAILQSGSAEQKLYGFEVVATCGEFLGECLTGEYLDDITFV